ncbi:hypothetical protein [Streptomyces gobiensis]|uniref:hypothetical protein n=1 Tax=Streptomyces gobiensis TaxID=2875706 RepID=UPI001E473BAF|nr:hypothetical protein [Streptomyces gobiensis]UGY92627.1 hypothetical protein test1122_13470 [Streptomyces gobiensis]
MTTGKELCGATHPEHPLPCRRAADHGDLHRDGNGTAWIDPSGTLAWSIAVLMAADQLLAEVAADPHDTDADQLWRTFLDHAVQCTPCTAGDDCNQSRQLLTEYRNALRHQEV